MKKLLTTFVIFLTLFFFNTHSAKAFNIVDFFDDLINNTFAPKYEVSSTSRQIDTTYSSKSTGLAKRVIPYSLDNEMKLKYITDFVSGKYKNIPNLSKCPNYSDPVDLIQLSIYILKNYEVTLDKATIDKHLDKYKDTVLQGNLDCFQIIFDNFYNTPQGSLGEKKESPQANKIIREPIPNNKISETDNVIVSNSRANLEILHRNLVPEKAGTNQGSSEIKKLFQNFLVPDKYQN